MDLEVCVDSKEVCASLDLEDQAVLSPEKRLRCSGGACWSWGCRRRPVTPGQAGGPSRLVLERKVAPSADRVSRQDAPAQEG